MAYLGVTIDLFSIFQEILKFAGTFNIWLVLAIFIVLAVGEFSIAIPYLLETIWILNGYHVITGIVSVPELVALMLVAMAGRAVGVIVFYYLVRYSGTRVLRIYNRLFRKASSRNGPEATVNNLIDNILSRINTLSSVSVAMGRLFYLRIPVSTVMAFRGRLKVLLIAVVISSIIWDLTYILIGIAGGTAKASQFRLILYSLAGIATVYCTRLIIQRISRLWVPVKSL